MEGFTSGGLVQYVVGGSILALAIATLKFVIDVKVALSNIQKSIDKTEQLEIKLQKLRDWCVKQGYDERQS